MSSRASLHLLCPLLRCSTMQKKIRRGGGRVARRASKHAGSMQVAQRCSIETRRLMTSEGVEAAEPKRHLTASHGEPETDPAHLPSVTRRGPAPARPPCTARARCPDGRRAVATDLLLLETTPRLSCHLMLSTPHSQCVYSCITLYRRSSNDQVISDRFTIETLKILNRILHRYTTGVPRAKPDCFILYKLGLPVREVSASCYTCAWRFKIEATPRVGSRLRAYQGSCVKFNI